MHKTMHREEEKDYTNTKIDKDRQLYYKYPMDEDQRSQWVVQFTF